MSDGPSPELHPLRHLRRARRSRRVRRLRRIGIAVLLPPLVAVVALGWTAGPLARSESSILRSAESAAGPAPSTSSRDASAPADGNDASPVDGPIGDDADPARDPIRSLLAAEADGADPVVITTTTEATTTAVAPTTTIPPTTTIAPTTRTVPVEVAAPPAVRDTTPPATVPPATVPVRTDSGQATWYRWKAGNCAHNALPRGTVVTVTAAESGRSATCTVGDRGAFGRPTIIDLDATVFEQLAPLGAGRISVIISW